MSLVNPNTVISNLINRIKQKNPSFSGLAPNSGGLFGGAEVRPISSGSTTRQIVEAGLVRQSTPTLNQIFPTIQTNFQNINETFKTIGNALSQLGQPPSQVSFEQEGQNVPDKQTSQANVTDSFLESLEKIKDFIGPTGIFVGLGLVTLLILTRNR